MKSNEQGVARRFCLEMPGNGLKIVLVFKHSSDASQVGTLESADSRPL